MRGRVLHLQHGTRLHSQYGENLGTAAAASGNLRLLIWLHEMGRKFTYRTCAVAAEHGHIECLRFAHRHGSANALSDTEAVAQAAEKGQLHCLVYLLDNGARWSWLAFTQAAAGGNIKCLL